MNRRKRHRQQLRTVLAYSSALALCLGGLGYAAWQSFGKLSPDAFGCIDGAPQAQTLVLFDASEPRFNDEQARSLRRYFDQLYERLDFNEKLSVYTSEGDQVASVLKPRFHICGQASSPEQLDTVGAVSAQSGYLRKERQRLYDKHLAPELDILLSAEPDESRRQLYQSPMLELITDLSRSPNLMPGSRLIIISDLIQNSDSAQFCRAKNHMPSFAVFQDRTIYQTRLKPQPLQGLQVELLMLQRLGYGQEGLRYCRDEEELRAFWRGYFKANGVSNPHFIRIRLGGTG